GWRCHDGERPPACGWLSSASRTHASGCAPVSGSKEASMESDVESGQPRRRSLLGLGRDRGRFIRSMIILGVAVVGGGTLLAAALFTSGAPVGGNTFSTGNVSINSSAPSGLVTFTALQGMAPGDVVTAPITITNNGSLQMRYAITSQTTENALAGQLRLTVKTGV